ncbi:MAG: transglutaminase family protein, partial [Opitutales bacterium]
MEPGVQTPEETLEKGSGSCRDTSWLLVNILRHLGLAARFVSGYLIQLKPDEKPLEGPAGAEKDFTDLHAWAEVYLPGAGWVGLDPTSGLFAAEGHLPLAATPEPRSAAAISGGVSKSEVDFGFEMDVTRVYESPRTTLPYSEAQWKRIDALGKRVDEVLRKGDVRLSMGGEPTFVSVDDFESPQWTTEALGEHKRQRGEDLLRRLYGRYGKGGFLHYGMGKWYPGEQLPRWAYSAIWRRDHQPIWENPALLADLREPQNADAFAAKDFADLLCDKLAVSRDYLDPGYEDNYYYLWRERRLPVNVDPIKNNVRDPLERQRIAKVFEQGLDKIIGYALPLERGFDAEGTYCWLSGPWYTRPSTLYLIPGDSPMGYRLPLESLPWAHEADKRAPGQEGMSFDLPPLPDHQELARQYFRRTGEGPTTDHASPWRDYFAQFAGKIPPHLRPRPRTLQKSDAKPEAGKAAPWVVRTALCVQPRERHLLVFMPPVPGVEDYIDLLTAIEATAGELQMPVVIEGYLPPHDPRLENLKITPDPGVIEVNIHPSQSWDELTERTTFLYGAAREARLGTEKFQVDGRHTGTGGGNHIVIGGPGLPDSPLLRRPKLLASLVNYWQQHPGLSYLFSGMFIGPTSQAPRLDEARDDSIYELEIANLELDRQL